VQGRVELHAVIAANGQVANVEQVSGNALLTAAALRTVRTWRYAPLLLNQQPTAVDTVITIEFRLPE
jgi:TonB family protein